MTVTRTYPDEPVGGFPVPPLEIRYEDGSPIHLKRCQDPSEHIEGLVDMYATFDPADRAQGIPPVGRESVRDWLEVVLDHGIDVVAVQDEAVIGHATLVPDSDQEYELAIFVHQDHRRQGVGSGLLRTLLGTAAEAGIEYVWLSVERWNTVAITLYEDVGFRTCDSASFELEMSLRLEAE